MRGQIKRKVSTTGRSKRPRNAKRSLPLFVKGDFLTRTELHGLTRYVLRREADFTHSSVIPEGMPEGTNDPSYRKSRVLYDVGEYATVIRHRLMSFLPEALRVFNRAPFDLSHIDVQVTASNDGDFFKVHNDNGHDEPPDIPRREVSFVYYFNSEPKAFTGGNLRFYDAPDGRIESSDDRRVRTVSPRQNTLVLFPSSYSHEVLPVKCPSRRFAHSRFTVNGWFIRQDPVAQQTSVAYVNPDGPKQDLVWLVDAVKNLTAQPEYAPPTLYLPVEAASVLSGLSLEYLYGLIRAEQLKAIYDGSWKVRRADIESL